MKLLNTTKNVVNRKQNYMNELINNWQKRMESYRTEAYETKSNYRRIKCMASFMTLRDCIKEIKQLTQHTD